MLRYVVCLSVLAVCCVPVRASDETPSGVLANHSDCERLF